MDLRQLKCFVAAAEELHFGRAAERLHMAPPALSRAVRMLEQELGAELFVRTTRAVTLTRPGLVFLEDAKAILARTGAAARAVREAAIGAEQRLRIGAIDSATGSFLGEGLAAFREQHPGTEVKLVEAMTAPQLQMLRTGRLDLCLVRPPLGETEFAFEPIMVERLVALIPARHPLAAAPSIRVDDLVNEPFVIPTKRARPYAYDLVMAHFETVGAVPRVVQEATDKPALLSCVAAGIGIALAPEWVSRFKVDGVTFKTLADVNLPSCPAGAVLGAAWRPHQKHPWRDAFLDLIRSRLDPARNHGEHIAAGQKTNADRVSGLDHP
jgi:DNA-binding transcriptional LysR family regulator